MQRNPRRTDSSRPVQVHRLRLTARGWLVVVGSFVGLVLAYSIGWPSLLAIVLFALGLVGIALLWVRLVPVRLLVEREVQPDLVEAGAPAVVRIRVAGTAGSASEWTDTVPRDVVAVGEISGSLPRRTARSTSVTIEYEVAGTRRGAATIGPLLITRSDPFGLAFARRAVGGATALVVLPAVHEITPPRALVRADADSVAAGSISGGDERDIVSRQYRPGDAMRSVDWRATAHRGELMVRSEVSSVANSTGIGLDARADVWPDAESFEFAVAGVASLAVAAGRHDAVRVATEARMHVCEGVPAALERLAVVQPNSGGSLAALHGRLREAHLQVVHLVTGPGALREIEMLPALGAASGGVVSIVAAGPLQAVHAPAGWHVVVIDPRVDPEAAWRANG